MDVLGIETGAGAWPVVHLKTSPLKVRVERFLSVTGDGFEERMSALSSYISQRELGDVRVSIVLPRESSLSIVLKIPAPRPEAIEGILAYELEKHVPFDPSDLCRGFQVLKRDGKVFSILLAAAKEDLVKATVERFSAAGLGPASVTTWHASLFNALYYSNNIAPEKNIAFIGMNNRDLTLDVFSGLIPVYSKCLGINGGEGAKGGWLQILEKELKRSVLGMSGPVEQRRLDECILISDEEPDEEFLRHLSVEMAVPVRSEGLKALGLPGTAAPALGAALGLVGKGRVRVNIAPAAEGVGRRRIPRIKTLSLALVVALLALSTWASYLLRDWMTVRRLESAMEGMRAGKGVVQRLVKREKELSERMKTLERIDGRALASPLDVLKDLTVLLPGDTWLTGMEYSGGSVTIEGYSQRASRLPMMMSRSRFMKDFEFAGPVARAQNGKERFRMNFKLRARAGAEPAGKGGR